jgi:Domain of unknown function (DUF4190)
LIAAQQSCADLKEPSMTTAQTSQPYPYRPLNTLAITTFLISVLLGPVAILSIPFGHLSLRQIRRTGERGDEFAVIGLAFGYLWLALVAFGVLTAVVLFVVAY